MKYTEYLTSWLEMQKPLLRQSTYEAYTVYINRHIIPFFEGFELESLTPLDIQRYVNTKLQGGRLDGKSGGLSLVSVMKHLSIIKETLNNAVLYGYIKVNPALAAKLPRRKTKYSSRCNFGSLDEIKHLVKSFEVNPTMHAIVVTALLYGLRRSEVLGLRWTSIDFENNIIKINHTVVKNLTIYESDETKTVDSTADYNLLPYVRKVLLKQRELTIDYHSDYVFSRPDGSVMRPDCLTRSFQRLLKRFGIPKMRFHDLRHCTASILFELGLSLEDVKNWLRHSDIETTSNIYLHYQKSRRKLVGDGISGLLDV